VVVWLGLITILALIEYLILGIMVVWARAKYEVAAPATTGDPIFERFFRVHQNTLEALIVFVPGLWLFGRFVNVAAAVTLGALFLLARIVYAAGYLWKPERRTIGAGATVIINGMLLLGSLLGLTVYAIYH
jgi:glutathione S-transferase